MDLWISGHCTDNNGNMALMNAIYDMRQFVVVVLVPDKSSATLANNFMQHMMMKFGLCHLVALDNSTPFKGSFIAMCQVINLNYNILTKWNHKGFYVEYSHRFLKKL